MSIVTKYYVSLLDFVETCLEVPITFTNFILAPWSLNEEGRCKRTSYLTKIVRKLLVKRAKILAQHSTIKKTA